MKSEIKKEWVYEQAPEEVWKYLTDADLLSLWLMPNNFKAIVGHEFQFKTNPLPKVDLDGIMHCTVLEIIPNKKLVYTWKAGPGNGVFPLDTTVEWTLEKYGAGTKLLLKQAGFKESNFTIFTDMQGGWEYLVQKMVDLLNNPK